MKKHIVTVALAGGFLLLLAIASLADVIPTWEAVFFRGSVAFNGQTAPLGSIVDAYDSSGVHCGTFTVGDVVDSAGIYGYMPVYRDDHTAPDTIDEGAEPDDSIYFKVNGRDVDSLSGNVIWGTNGDTNNVDLWASGTIVVTGVDLPEDTTAAPEDTVRFQVGVSNDGDGLDFYGVTSASANGWQTVNKDTFTYANPGDTVYVYFDVIIPTWPVDTTDIITYSVFSYLDTSKHVDSSVGLIVSASDVGDEPFVELPNGFHLNQNYPNPFNPTTTISFTLSSRSSVRLEIFDVLGRCVDTRDLGLLPSGGHDIEYDASGYPSGVYFYRVVTEASSQTRKMVLVK